MGKGSPFGMRMVAPALGVDCSVLDGGCGARKNELCRWTSGPKAGLVGKQRCCSVRRQAADEARTKRVREAGRVG